MRPVFVPIGTKTVMGRYAMETVFFKDGTVIKQRQQHVGARVLKNFAISHLLRHMYSKQFGIRTATMKIPGCYDPRVVRDAFRPYGDWVRVQRRPDRFMESLEITDQALISTLLQFRVS